LSSFYIQNNLGAAFGQEGHCAEVFAAEIRWLRLSMVTEPVEVNHKGDDIAAKPLRPSGHCGEAFAPAGYCCRRHCADAIASDLP
jgi:hypothetical protein